MSRMMVVVRDGVIEKIFSDADTSPLVTVVYHDGKDKYPFVQKEPVSVSQVSTEELLTSISGAEFLEAQGIAAEKVLQEEQTDGEPAHENQKDTDNNG